MADFVAVIRRAVDGLSDNTPEMRVRVYERARGAVQRQLENMKPRPPEDMLRRQLEKLEAAIREVESEHAEALPGDAVPAVEEMAPVAVAPKAMHPEPVKAEAEAEAVHAPEPVHVSQPKDAGEPVEETPVREPQPEPEPVRAEAAHDAPADHAYEPVNKEDSPSRHSSADEEAPVEEWPPRAVTAYLQPLHEVAPDHHGPGSLPEWREERQEPVAQEGQPEVAAARDHGHLVEEPHSRLIEAPPEPVVAEAGEPAATKSLPPIEPFAWDSNAFDELPPVPAQRPSQPVSKASFDDVDLFSDVHGSTAKKSEAAGDGWRELKELAGFDKTAGDEELSASPTPMDLDQVMVQKLQGKSFRMEPKRRRVSMAGVLLALVGLAIVAGAGYAAWINRQALNDMVTGLVNSAPKSTTVGDKGPTPPAAPTQPAAKAPPAPNAGSAANIAPPAAQPNAQPGTDVASANNDNTVSTKFTQRLLENGSEVDDGPSPIPGQPPVAEGKSVAQQNVAAATPTPSVQPDAVPAQTVTPNSPSSVPPPAAPAAATVGSPEKLFLYEERLGQTSPTAIEGTVTWTAQEETGDDGRPQPTIQGNIAVPERGLTAIITFKRNTDSSLPASHLVELVFSLPPNFEGGAIDSVQRIAMKATEQDRGDALVAVPAKITDDFHMVALNDFPDARKTNLELLRSRNWIDIPITYRNGRRALLTLNKGATGNDVFNKVIAQWAATGDVSSN